MLCCCWSVLYICVSSNWSSLLIKFFISLLILCLINAMESEILKFPTIIVLQSISSLILSTLLYIFWWSFITHVNIDNCCMFFLYWDIYQNIISIFFSCNNFWLTLYFIWYYLATQCLFSLLFAWNIFSHPFIFNLCVPLDLKWLSCSTILLNKVF